MKTKGKKLNPGFTLIELLIVILIISVLAGFIVRGMGTAIDRANEAAARSMVETVNNGLVGYKNERGSLPGAGSPSDPYDPGSNVISEVIRELRGRYAKISEKDLGVVVPGKRPRLATKEEINDTRVDKVIIDPWGFSYVARENYSKEIDEPWMHKPELMDVYSFGKNGKDDTIEMVPVEKNDDIGNW